MRTAVVSRGALWQRAPHTRPAVRAPAASSDALVTCRRCFTRFRPSENTVHSCRFHPALYSGGELAKAIGFVREGDAPEQQLQAIMGRRGLLRFWDCCGAEEEAAPGCKLSWHITFDDALNERHGWDGGG